MEFHEKYNRLKGFEKLCVHGSESFDSGYGDYYLETGRYKPWSVQTLKATLSRGLVESHRRLVNGVYYVKLSEKGLELGREIRKKLHG